jgi:hypothetical protein
MWGTGGHQRSGVEDKQDAQEDTKNEDVNVAEKEEEETDDGEEVKEVDNIDNILNEVDRNYLKKQKTDVEGQFTVLWTVSTMGT